LLDLQVDISTALNRAEPEAFQHAVLRFLEMYEALLEVSEVNSPDGAKQNLAKLSDSAGFFERPIYYNWSAILLEVFERATNEVSTGENYVALLSRLPNSLFLRIKTQGDQDLGRHFLSLSPILLRRVENWWVRTVEQQGETQHGPCVPVTLRAPFYGIHDRVIREFVSPWETLKNSMILPKAGQRWSEMRTAAIYFEEHISHTLVMICDCVLRGDRNASEWESGPFRVLDEPV